MASVSGTVLIDRPRDDVFAYVSDYENDPQWRSGVSEMRHEPPGQVSIGVRTHEVMRFMGRDMATEAEVVEYEPGRRIGFRTISGALSAHGYRLVEDAGTGTRLTYHADAELTAAYRPFTALIKWAFSRRVGADLTRLKAILEGANHRQPNTPPDL